MNFIELDTAVNPNIHYNLYQDFICKQSGYSSEVGDVYVLLERNGTPRVKKYTVIDLTKVPFKRGTIYFCEKCQDEDFTRIILSHDKISYSYYASSRFSKGDHVGQVYELAKKIQYINENLLPNEKPVCSGVVLDHQGHAVIGKQLMDLDLTAVESEYKKTQARINPNYCGQITTIAAVVALSILAVMTTADLYQ